MARKRRYVRRHLQRMAEGPDVIQLQRALNREAAELPEMGLNISRVKVDGMLGSETIAVAKIVLWFLGAPVKTRRTIARNAIISKGAQRLVRNEKYQRGRATRRRAKLRVAARRGKLNRLSPHFHIREFACKDGTPVPEYAREALAALCRNHLEPLRAVYGYVGITSGYRHEAYNAAIGGVSNSLHRYEYHRNAVAADTTCRSGSVHDWGRRLESTNPDGLGIYPGSGFTHTDNRGRVGMARSRWTG